jgi:hypothetical protein
MSRRVRVAVPGVVYKEIGALFIRGGGHERGSRAGTLNVPGIVGFGEACRLAKRELKGEAERTARLRDKLEQRLLAELPDVWINGYRQDSVVGDVPGDTSTGSAVAELKRSGTDRCAAAVRVRPA